MDPSKSLGDQLRRWLQVELIDAAVAVAIQRWEDSQRSGNDRKSTCAPMGKLKAALMMVSIVRPTDLPPFSTTWNQ